MSATQLARSAPGFPVRPQQDNVVIKLMPIEETGDRVKLINEEPEGTRRAVVYAVGPGHYIGCTHCKNLSTFVPTELQVGELVLVYKYAGDDYRWDLSAPRNNSAIVPVGNKLTEARGVQFRGGTASFQLDTEAEWRIVREGECMAVLEPTTELERAEVAKVTGASSQAAE